MRLHLTARPVVRWVLVGGACVVGVVGSAAVARAADRDEGSCVMPVGPAAGRRIVGASAGTRAQAGTNVLFVNYDGATLMKGEQDDAATNTTVFAEFVGTYAPYGDGSKRAASLQAVRANWARYAVNVVDVRPTDGAYTMCVTTPTNPFGDGVLGAAPPDCDDETASSVVLVFHGVEDEYSAVAQATTISHEIAHSYGLEHVDQPEDIMNPNVVGMDPAFLDECLPLVGAGSPIRCVAQHQRYCGTDGQRSHQELLWMFGPSSPDTAPPEVVISQPTSDEVFMAPALVTVVAEAHDDVGIASAELYVDGAARGGPDLGAPHQWIDEVFSEGRHCLRVDVRDHGANLASSPEVCFTVLPGEDGASTGGGGESSGSVTAGSADSAEGSEDGEAGCGCAAAGGSAWSGLFAALLGLRRRRRG